MFELQLTILILCLIAFYRNHLVYKWLERRCDEIYTHNLTHEIKLEYPSCYDELLFDLTIWTYKQAFPDEIPE